jgi:hypothetical protein
VECADTEKNAKIAEVCAITLRFGHEILVKTTFFIKLFKRVRAKLSITIENFKISKYLKSKKS